MNRNFLFSFSTLCVFAMVFFFHAGLMAAQGEAPVMPSQRMDPMIQKIVSEISQERIIEILKKMESFETRNTMSDPNQPNRGVGAARQWIFDQFKSYSPRLDVSYDSHNIPKSGRVWKDVEIRNVVAVLPGKMEQARDRWILIGAHYDSLNLRVPAEVRNDAAKTAEIPAPGVTDNASGIACTMECARVMSQYDFDATLVFVAFIAEEQGLLGARGFAGRLKEQNRFVQALLNNDIIGSEMADNGVTENRRMLVFSEDPNDSPSRQVARFIKKVGERYMPEVNVDMVFQYDRLGRGGDHTPFNQVGYPAVRFTTPTESYANQHSATDTFANTSPLLITRTTKVNAAAAAAMALAPRSPITMPEQTGERASTTNAAASTDETARPSRPAAQRTTPIGISRGAGYDAVLRWDHPNPEPDLAGYMIVVRSTTAADWEREIWAGNVHEFTLKNTPVDQLVFGVKSVDREGHESPASAYWMLPRRTN